MGVRNIVNTSARCIKEELLLLPSPKAEVNTVLAVIDLEGIALSICPKNIHDQTENKFQSRLCTCGTYTDNKAAPILFVPALENLKKDA